MAALGEDTRQGSIPVPTLTCHIKLDLQHDLVGQCCIPQELVGFLHRPILRGNAIDGQHTVPDLQQPTPASQKEEASERPQWGVTLSPAPSQQVVT